MLEEIEIALENGCLQKKLCHHVPVCRKKRLDLEPNCTATFARKNSAGKLARRTTTSSEAVTDF